MKWIKRVQDGGSIPPGSTR